MEPAAKAPAGFADRVMSRVRAGARFSGADAPFRAASAMPWWIRALSDPAGAIPITLGILFLIIAGRPQVFAGILAPLLRATSILLVSLPEWSGAGLASPLASLPVQAGFALGILPIVLLASSPLFRWSEALFSRKRP